MKPEDIGPILAMTERERRKARRAELELKFRQDYGSLRPSHRAMRAHQFAQQVAHMARNFIPDACFDAALNEFMLCAYDGDWEIAQVPPERDAERARVTLEPQIIVKPST